ncbi:MAG TPA: PEGA domain-containing protein [Terriglobales bacterium]|nr:PEGA domain-containing protein [Terriglobales bacterium]
MLKLLREDPQPRVKYLIEKYGIAFSVSPDVEKELTEAGAGPEILEVVRRLAPKPQEAKPAPTVAAPVLVINAKPGQAEVYLDDERRGQTSSGGTLKVAGLVPGTHKLRLSLAGYQSFEVNVEMVAGEINTVVANLQPLELPPPPREAPPVSPAPAASSANAKAPAAVEPKRPTDPNNPLSLHDPGIYYFDQRSSAAQLLQLEEAPSAGRSARKSRGGGFGAFGGFGAGIKWKSMIYGSKARLRIAAGQPLFYFYFPTAETPTALAFSEVFRPSSSPNSFVLVRLESKKNERQIPAKGAMNATVEPKDLVAFDYEKLATGIFRVHLKNELGPGEYGFLYGGVLDMMSEPSIFDFGVDGGK